MIIPPKAVEALTNQAPILNLSSREKDNPEGVGFDLRLSGLHIIDGHGSLLVETRQTPEAKKLHPDTAGIFTLKPNIWYLTTTMEKMCLPPNLAGLVFPRSTLFRSGVELHTSITPPGYEGSLTFGLCVRNPKGFKLELGARFCHLVLVQVERGATKYRGQWNGGRVDSPSEERQI